MIHKLLRSAVAVIIAVFFVVSGSGQNSNTNVANRIDVPEPPAKSTVRGRVYYGDNGHAVRRASVMLVSEKSPDPEGHAGLTDSEGYFEIKNVKAGTYYSIINAPGIVSPLAFADFSQMGRGNSEKEILDGAFTDFDKIVVNGINDIEVQIPAKRGGAISGRVMYEDGDPAVGVKIEILRKDGDRFIPVISNFSSIIAMIGGHANQTDDRGAYRFPGLPRGEYKIKVTENISHSDTRTRDNDVFVSLLTGGNSLVSVFYPDTMDQAKAQIVPVELGTEQAELNVIIPSHNFRRLEGKIIAGKDKTPLKKATVYLKRKDVENITIFSEFGSGQQTSITDDDGKWSFKQLPKGAYQIVVEPPPVYMDEYGANRPSNSYASTSNRPAYYTGNVMVSSPPQPKYAKKLQEVTLEDKDITDMVLEIGFGATLSGTVSADGDAALPENIIIEAASEGEQATTSGVVNSKSTTGANIARTSDFRLESIAAGKTNLRISIGDTNYYVKSAVAGGKDLLTNSFELKDGEAMANVQIVLAKDVGTLKGTVLNDAKDPVKTAQLTLVPVDAAKRKNPTFYRTVVTDEEGNFLVKLPPFEYAVIFDFRKKPSTTPEKADKWLEDSLKNATKVTIHSGETSTLKLTVAKR